MLKSHEKFHSENGKRLILVVDDEYVNREIMRSLLEEEYELLFAEDGEQALEMTRENQDALSLVLLDLVMPNLSGMEVLKRMKVDPDISQIPVIVITSDRAAEVESLMNGASDFIPKPYPQQEVIMARILRAIELSEDREIIGATERDELTGLYNREYFYSYAKQYDQHHKNVEMDAIVLDVNHFRMINERFGTAYGDNVLMRLSHAIRAAVADNGGIVCRREADTFLVYCPHGKDYATILEDSSIGLSDDTRVWLRMGVYANVDKSLEIERRFDRAKMAADSVQGSFTRTIAIYDDTLHQKELYSEQLVQDFGAAIKGRQFKVYYQPKFAIQSEVPRLISAEALVRWEHPTLGMVSPGAFIPLFEDNGLIQQLDIYVWNETAAQIREWKDSLGFSVPVSVNVSRIDMYDPKLIETLVEIVKKNNLQPDDLLLEITESAYMQDSSQIIETVNGLRQFGFKVEMDDFGTGYSSLNMISSLPIDALKLDMWFVQSAFGTNGNTKMLEIVIDIADYLSVPVIAEGVETETQLLALRKMGCDCAQGYFFSPADPPENFERFLRERMADDEGVPTETSEMFRRLLRSEESTYDEIVQALALDYFSIYYVNMETGEFTEYVARSWQEELGTGGSGKDFFGKGRDSIANLVHSDDLDLFMSSFTKENVVSAIEHDKSFTLTYRIVLGERPLYVHMKATRMQDKFNNRIVIGVSDIDQQVQREQEHAQLLRVAKRDTLTGVKSKLAYSEDEQGINYSIGDGTQQPFAVAVCDVNGLKQVNDILGHHAGDEYLKRACHIICDVFKHSPVYRVGGDEFVAILRGNDYDIREELIGRLIDNNHAERTLDEVSIAGGLAEYLPGDDESLVQVFDRADAAMYENKKKLKAIETVTYDGAVIATN